MYLYSCLFGGFKIKTVSPRRNKLNVAQSGNDGRFLVIVFMQLGSSTWDDLIFPKDNDFMKIDHVFCNSFECFLVLKLDLFL